MDLPAVFIAIVGLALSIYAAMETEPEDIRRRAAIGSLGLALLIWGVSQL